MNITSPGCDAGHSQLSEPGVLLRDTIETVGRPYPNLAHPVIPNLAVFITRNWVLLAKMVSAIFKNIKFNWLSET
jgi:hypothetical protein